MILKNRLAQKARRVGFTFSHRNLFFPLRNSSCTRLRLQITHSRRQLRRRSPAPYHPRHCCPCRCLYVSADQDAVRRSCRFFRNLSTSGWKVCSFPDSAGIRYCRSSEDPFQWERVLRSPYPVAHRPGVSFHSSFPCSYPPFRHDHLPWVFLHSFTWSS